VTNYFAPAFHITVNGSRLEADVSYEIEQVEVVSRPDTMDTFSFTIANPMPKMRWTHTPDADLFREGHAVVISMGYVDDLQLMIEGEITEISPSFPAGDIPTVQIDGRNLLHRLHGSNNTRTFQGVSDKDIAEQIGQKLNLQVEADDPGVQYDYVIQPGQTDLEFLRQRAEKIHFQLLVEGKKLIFRKSQEATPKTYTLVWAQAQMTAAATGSNILPLTTFSLKMNATAPPTKVQTRAWDPTTKQALVSNATSSDQCSKMNGTQAAGEVPSNAFAGADRTLVQTTTPFATQAEVDEHNKATYNNKAMGLVTGTAETIGVPDLRAGTVIQMLGVGPRFEGYYLIDQATHTIGGDGYKTSLNLRRNAVS
jgi:phage protein D